MKLRLQEMQKVDSKAQKLRQQKISGYKEIYEILHHHGLLFVYKVIQTDLIGYHHNDFLIHHFGIKKIYEILA